MHAKLQVRVRQTENPAEGDIEVFIFEQTGQQIRGFKLVAMDPVDSGVEQAISGLGAMTREQAATLMDDLFASGIRPTTVRNSTGDLAAKDKHIAFAEKTVEGLIQCLSRSKT